MGNINQTKERREFTIVIFPCFTGAGQRTFARTLFIMSMYWFLPIPRIRFTSPAVKLGKMSYDFSVVVVMVMMMIHNVMRNKCDVNEKCVMTNNVMTNKCV